jgi:hypothetical protein
VLLPQLAVWQHRLALRDGGGRGLGEAREGVRHVQLTTLVAAQARF